MIIFFFLNLPLTFVIGKLDDNKFHSDLSKTSTFIFAYTMQLKKFDDIYSASLDDEKCHQSISKIFPFKIDFLLCIYCSFTCIDV